MICVSEKSRGKNVRNILELIHIYKALLEII